MDEQICTAITSMLARIGIKVDLNAQTKAKFFAKILAPKYDTDFYHAGLDAGDLRRAQRALHVCSARATASAAR